MSEQTAEKDAMAYVDKTTREFCPTRGALLCTVTDPHHRHVAAHMVTRPGQAPADA